MFWFPGGWCGGLYEILALLFFSLGAGLFLFLFDFFRVSKAALAMGPLVLFSLLCLQSGYWREQLNKGSLSTFRYEISTRRGWGGIIGRQT